jgi:hypothetical protein
MLDPVIEKMGEALLVLRADRRDASAESRGTNVDQLNGAAESPPLIEFDHKLKSIAHFHKHPAFDLDAGVTDIQHLTGCRKRPSLETSEPADSDA